MRWAVFAHQTGAVETQHHRQFLNSYIMNYIVISPLHKRGVNIAERQHTVLCHSSGESHGMSFGYTDIECTIRHLFHHIVQGTSCRHGRSDSYNARVLLRQLNQGMSEDILEEWW